MPISTGAKLSARWISLPHFAPAMQAPPTLGQHTDQVLQQMLGLPAEQITALRWPGPV
ncbi:MAG: hypothetical protein ABIO19_13985 [Burkholderiaceae bacterium]